MHDLLLAYLLVCLHNCIFVLFNTLCIACSKTCFQFRLKQPGFAYLLAWSMACFLTCLVAYLHPCFVAYLFHCSLPYLLLILIRRLEFSTICLCPRRFVMSVNGFFRLVQWLLFPWCRTGWDQSVCKPNLLVTALQISSPHPVLLLHTSWAKSYLMSVRRNSHSLWLLLPNSLANGFLVDCKP
jgi:hypothetical protein